MLQRGLNQPQPGSFLGVFCIGAIAKLLMPRSLKRSMLKNLPSNRNVRIAVRLECIPPTP
jgi:hypothetical protein